MTQRIGVQFDGASAGAVGAARKTTVAIDEVSGAANRSGPHLRVMEKDLGRVERGALAGSGAFHGLGRSVAFASGAFIGAAGFVEVLKSSIDVVLAAQTSIARLDKAVENAHASVKAMTPILEAHAAAARKLGFDDNETRDAEAKLVTAFGATKKSLDELRVAEDLARATSTDLGTATRQLILLQEGNARAAKQFGLTLPDLTKKQWEAKAAADGLNLAQEKGKTLYDELLPRIHAQAQAFANTPAGKIAEFHAQVQHLQESIGTGLLPIVDKYLTEVDDWLAKSGNQKKVTDDVRKVVDELAGALHDAKVAAEGVLKVAEPVAKALGGWKTVIEDIIALKLATTIFGWTKTAEGFRLALLALSGPEVLASLAAVSAALLAVDELTHHTKGNIQTGGSAKLNTEVFEQGGKYYQRVTVGRNVVTKEISAAQARQTLAGSAGGTGGGFVPSPLGGFGATNPSVSASLVSTAKSALGNAYQFGGAPSLSKPTDCSGLMVAVFAKNGITIPRTSQEQYARAPIQNQRPLLPGDLVFSEGVHPGHVGLYIGNGMVLEDPHTGDHVKTVTLGEFGWNGESARWWGGVKTTEGGSTATGTSTKKSPYGPDLTTGTQTGGGAPAKTKWVGATQATITTAQGSVSALLKGLPADLDPIEKNARAHILAIQDSLHVHMTPAELAKDRVELTKWGKVLHDEINKNAKVIAAAAAEAKKVYDRALSLDVSNILRGFDRNFQAQMTAFDRETQRGLAALAAKTIARVAQTPEEKALADFVAGRAQAAQATTDAQQQSDLQAAYASGDPQKIAAALDAINQTTLDKQQQVLQAAADASRVAADQATTDAQDAENARATAAQQAYQDQRDAQKQALQDLNDDQRTALQNSLDDWVQNLEDKKKSWADFVAWLQTHGYDTSGLVNPSGGASGSGGGSSFVGHSDSTPGGHGGFAKGGKIPGRYVGRDDTILARVTPGETVIDRKLTAALEDMVANGGGNAGPMVAIFALDGVETARVLAQPMTAEQARKIGYTIQRG